MVLESKPENDITYHKTYIGRDWLKMEWYKNDKFRFIYRKLQFYADIQKVAISVQYSVPINFRNLNKKRYYLLLNDCLNIKNFESSFYNYVVYFFRNKKKKLYNERYIHHAKYGK